MAKQKNNDRLVNAIALGAICGILIGFIVDITLLDYAGVGIGFGMVTGAIAGFVIAQSTK